MNKLSDNFQKYFMAPTFENMDLEIAILNGIKKLEEENFKLSAGTCVVGEGIIAGEHGHALCPLSIQGNKLKHKLILKKVK